MQEVTLGIVTSITIPADRETVWRTFMAVENWPKWSPWGLSFPHQPRFEVGARFFVTVPAPLLSGITLKFPCRVTVLENPRVICWTGRVLGVSGFHRFTLHETLEGCRVVSEEEFRSPFGLLLWPLRSTFRARVAEFLTRLRGAAATTDG
jgi:uncharacterized protein YndB with AHSA1/START domain